MRHFVPHQSVRSADRWLGGNGVGGLSCKGTVENVADNWPPSPLLMWLPFSEHFTMRGGNDKRQMLLAGLGAVESFLLVPRHSL